MAGGKGAWYNGEVWHRRRPSSDGVLYCTLLVVFYSDSLCMQVSNPSRPAASVDPKASRVAEGSWQPPMPVDLGFCIKAARAG